jgi:signal transduction histidine kinase
VSGTQGGFEPLDAVTPPYRPPARDSDDRRSRRDPDLDSRDSEMLARMDESLLDPEERALLEARRLAEMKVDLYRETAKVLIPGVALLVIPPLAWIGLLILLFGGMKLARRYYAIVVEPRLRERIVKEEISKRVSADVRKERHAVEHEHSRRLEELSASIAHEIRNPITAAKSLVQQMEEDPSAAENVEYARVALGELERVERSVSHLLKYAREEDLRQQPLALADVLDSALETFRERAARSNIELAREFDGRGDLSGDPEKLRRVFINLIGNAIDALEEAQIPAARVDVSLGENLAGTAVWARVADNGPGVPEAARRRIFEPFVTSKERGTGLGLAITHKLVTAHGGEIELVAREPQGAEFVVTLPRRAPVGGKS